MGTVLMKQFVLMCLLFFRALLTFKQLQFLLFRSLLRESLPFFALKTSLALSVPEQGLGLCLSYGSLQVVLGTSLFLCLAKGANSSVFHRLLVSPSCFSFSLQTGSCLTI